MKEKTAAAAWASNASQLFANAAGMVAKQSGRPATFGLAVFSIVAWLACGPYFGYSDTWQLVINTGTTIVTFLMVFLIQNSQNRDSAAIQVKLNELIRSSAAQNFYIGVEHLTEEEIDEIRKKCESRASIAREAGSRAVQAANADANQAADNL